MATDVSAEECFRLARAMTFKNTSADLSMGAHLVSAFGAGVNPEIIIQSTEGEDLGDEERD